MKEKWGRRAFLCGCGVIAVGALASGCEFPQAVAEETIPTADAAPVQPTAAPETQGEPASAPPLVAATATGVPPTSTPVPTMAPTTTPDRPVQVLCPFGLVNDPYPGRCRRYVDKNGNGICDWSEPV